MLNRRSQHFTSRRRPSRSAQRQIPPWFTPSTRARPWSEKSIRATIRPSALRISRRRWRRPGVGEHHRHGMATARANPDRVRRKRSGVCPGDLALATCLVEHRAPAIRVPGDQDRRRPGKRGCAGRTPACRPRRGRGRWFRPRSRRFGDRPAAARTRAAWTKPLARPPRSSAGERRRPRPRPIRHVCSTEGELFAQDLRRPATRPGSVRPAMVPAAIHRRHLDAEAGPSPGRSRRRPRRARAPPARGGRSGISNRYRWWRSLSPRPSGASGP